MYSYVNVVRRTTSNRTKCGYADVTIMCNRAILSGQKLDVTSMDYRITIPGTITSIKRTIILQYIQIFKNWQNCYKMRFSTFLESYYRSNRNFTCTNVTCQ